MNARDLARYYAIVRLVFGGVLLVFPRIGVKDLVGSTDRRAKMVGRMLAARDLVIGVGGYVAVEDVPEQPGARAGRVRPWVTYAALADGVDALSILLAYKQLPRWRRGVMFSLAAGGAAWGGYLISQLDE